MEGCRRPEEEQSNDSATVNEAKTTDDGNLKQINLHFIIV